MKKNILILTTLLFVVFTLGAQRQIKYGVVAGFDYTTIANIEDNDWRPGFKAGIKADIPLNEKFNFQPALLFSTKGCEGDIYNFSTDYSHLSYTITSNYIELPLLFTYNIPLSGKTKFLIAAGPYLAIGIGGKTKMSIDNGFDSYELKWNTFDGFNEEYEEYSLSSPSMERFDWGLATGIGMQINKVQVLLNYDFGFQDLYEDNFSDQSTGRNSHWVVGISAGYFF